jgi:hypothetical protein
VNIIQPNHIPPRLSTFVIFVAVRMAQVRGGKNTDYLAPANDATRYWLEESKCEFGDPRFDWSAGAAAEVADDAMRCW